MWMCYWLRKARKVCEPECTGQQYLSVVYQGITKSNINSEKPTGFQGSVKSRDPMLK